MHLSKSRRDSLSIAAAAAAAGAETEPAACGQPPAAAASKSPGFSTPSTAAGTSSTAAGTYDRKHECKHESEGDSSAVQCGQPAAWSDQGAGDGEGGVARQHDGHPREGARDRADLLWLSRLIKQTVDLMMQRMTRERGLRQDSMYNSLLDFNHRK